jgi:hypothetical protein
MQGKKAYKLLQNYHSLPVSKNKIGYRLTFSFIQNGNNFNGSPSGRL